MVRSKTGYVALGEKFYPKVLTRIQSQMADFVEVAAIGSDVECAEYQGTTDIWDGTCSGE